MLRLSAAENQVSRVSGGLRAQRYVRVTQSDFLNTMRGEQAGTLSAQNSLQKAAVGGTCDC